MLRPMIDYLTMSFKPDMQSSQPGKVDKKFIFDLFSLNPSDFIDIGRKGFYEHCYQCNNISIYEPYPDKASSQGWCVSISGQGLRYYEQIQKDGEFVDLWRELFTRFRDLTLRGYSFNVSRLDIAHDDFDGFLDLDLISSSANDREFVSQFRSAYEVGYRKMLTGEGTGRTIYFGNRKSSTFCRFYDKKLEQIQKYKNDREKLKELALIPHWVRMEFEFKREQAMKIVNMICDLDDFPKYYAGVVNSYIRFVDPVDENVTRCPLKSWWKRFIGTVERFNLSVGEYKSFGFARTKSFVEKYVTPMLYTLLSQMDVYEFLNMIRNHGGTRLKSKHKLIIAGLGRDVDEASRHIWDFMNPVPAGMRCAYEV
jgi:phage replication initiation protein